VFLPIEMQTGEIGSQEEKTPPGRTKGNSTSPGLTQSDHALYDSQHDAYGGQLKGCVTISSVQTLLIHTFSLPSTPFTFSSSTPSHQHRRAGFLQKRSSFWAIPTALLFARSLPLISVRSRASAMLQITALLGSPARCPHLSSWLKPLMKLMLA
jgi:hypothetical protein